MTVRATKKSEPIDFFAIAKESEVRRGKIFSSPTFGWVVEGHPDVNLVLITPPKFQGRDPDKIVNNCWIWL